MVKNTEQSRIVLTFLKLIMLLIVALNCIYCGTPKTKKAEDMTNFASAPQFGEKKWEEIFTDGENLTFTEDNKEYELITLTYLAINAKGEYIVFDSKMSKVIHFDKNRNFIRLIGRNGAGPGEYQMAHTPILDEADNLYFCDFGQMRINRYNAPGYTYHSQIKLGYPVRDMIVGQDGNVTMYLGQGEYALKQVDETGQVIKRGFKIPDEMFNLFLARFNLGRISPVKEQNAFLFFYPDDYRIYLMNFDYTPLHTYYTDNPSRFLPGKIKFPRHLSPYDFTPAHAEWWSSSMHPGLIHYLGNGFFMVEVLGYEKLSAKRYFNIHHLDGTTVAVGIPFPNDSKVVYCKNGYIYIVERPTLNDQGEETPLRLQRYKFKLGIR